jgi:hypothetical protein
MTHTLINPQVDRSWPIEKQDKDLAAKIVKETDAGIVIRGARMVSTLCAYSDDLLVLSSTYIAIENPVTPAKPAPGREQGAGAYGGLGSRPSSGRRGGITGEPPMSNEPDLIVFDPRGVVETEPLALSERPATLDGLRLGVLDNTKWNANRLLSKTVAKLQEEISFAAVNYYRKESFSKEADPALIAAIAADNDIVVTAIGD